MQATSPGGLCLSGSYSDTLSQTENGTVTFNNCEFFAGTGTNGTVSVSASGSTITLSYTNFSIAFGGITETVSFAMTCTTSGTISCSMNSSITGIDGRTYAISNVSVSGNSTSGYNATATVTDPDHGIISINASLVKFDCPAPNDGRPSTGTITFSSNGKSGSVTFTSCTNYTVTAEGVANPYSW